MMLRCPLGLGWGGVECSRSWYADDVTLPVGVGVGWGGMLTFMVRWWCYAARWGWGGVGWDVNVHGTLMMLRCPLGLGWGGGGMLTFMVRWWCYAARWGWGGVGWDVNVHGMLMMLRCPLGLGWGGGGMNMYIIIYINIYIYMCVCVCVNGYPFKPKLSEVIHLSSFTCRIELRSWRQ